MTRRYFIVNAIKAVLALIGLLIGLSVGGLIGASIGQGLAVIAAYPTLVWLASRLGAWDPLHNLAFVVLAACCIVGALSSNWHAVVALAR